MAIGCCAQLANGPHSHRLGLDLNFRLTPPSQSTTMPRLMELGAQVSLWGPGSLVPME